LPTSQYGNELAEFISKLPQVELEASDVMVQDHSTGTSTRDNSTESSTSTVTNTPPIPLPSQDPLPEVEIYLGLMVTVALIDSSLYNEAALFSTSLVNRLQTYNKRTLNPLAAKVYFYYSRSFELCDRLAEIRPALLAAHRTASLRRDDETHVTLLNLLLRNYLHYNLYDQADKLQAKTTLKEDTISSNQLARFRFYQGRIKGIQLDYTGAYTVLQEALTKAPQHSALGFRQTVTKNAVIVQLLIGEIPERSIFRQKGMKTVLKPYLRLTQAVRVGGLVSFHDVIKEFENVYRKDKTFTLIQRLRHNVIKTGLRKINISYSRISLADVCAKLHLDSEEDAEFIVSKAVRDGVIDATVDHLNRWIQSKENVDVYVTQEPLDAFTERIKYCLKTHNEAVKAMRYPPEAVKKRVEEDDEEREERKKQEQEIADKLSEVDEDDEI